MRIVFCFAVVSACLLSGIPSAGAQTPPQTAAIGTWGVDTNGLSRTIKPGDDFYRYVNAAWLETAEPPPGVPFMDSFVEVFLVTEERIGGIIEQSRQTTDGPGSPEQMIGDFHRSHADMEVRNARGLTPIASTLALIAGTEDRPGIARIMGLPWMDAMIGGGVFPDADDSTRMIAAVGVGGLTMPSRDYYLAEAEPYIGHRAALRDYIASSFSRAGIPDADGRANRVMALEMEIARRQWSLNEQRDANRMNNVMTPAQLDAYAPGFPWAALLAEQGMDDEPRVKVTTDTAVRDMALLFAETSVEDLQSFLVFKTLDAWADSLSEPWVQAHFDFHNKRLQDTPQRRPANLESIGSVNAAMGEEIGRIYVEQYFGSADRAQVAVLVDYLRDSYRERIQTLEWMDASTRAEALDKLEKITSHIGYPERWHDRSMVRIAADDLVGNQVRLAEWAKQDNLRKLAEGARDWEFPLDPQEINAGYSPSKNSMTYPAGILQPPFFDRYADAAVKFGSTAAVIGHEFGHAFDDQGSRSDGDGRLRNWWSASSRAEFERRTAGLVDQFNAYDALPGLKVNGRQNLGENIGDLGGLSVAYAAYRSYVEKEQGGEERVIDGFTGDQRFFMAWAQVWRNITSEGETRRRTLADPHSPGEFRVNGIVRNVDAWYAAFNVQPDDDLYLSPEQRVKIW